MLKQQIDIQHPDWLPDALERLESTCRLARSGKIPPIILGVMLIVPCLRLLRCIYGSDHLAIQGLMLHIENREQLEAEVQHCPN